MLYEETYIAVWFNLREGSSIKKIIKKAMSNENCMDKPVSKAICKSESKFRVVPRLIQPDILRTLSFEL